MNSYCIAIPCYRHGKALGAVLTRLETYALPVVVVDDGNEPAEAALIEKACAACQRVTLLKNPKNLGKGGALITALKYAATQNFSHVIQLDADGQHCLEDLPRLMALSEQEPSHLISACPIYDDSVPKARLYGRYAT
nr:glycosyltransferase family 2 protein [Succinivibrio sp.]